MSHSCHITVHRPYTLFAYIFSLHTVYISGFALMLPPAFTLYFESCCTRSHYVPLCMYFSSLSFIHKGLSLSILRKREIDDDVCDVRKTPSPPSAPHSKHTLASRLLTSHPEARKQSQLNSFCLFLS